MPKWPTSTARWLLSSPKSFLVRSWCLFHFFGAGTMLWIELSPSFCWFAQQLLLLQLLQLLEDLPLKVFWCCLPCPSCSPSNLSELLVFRLNAPLLHCLSGAPPIWPYWWWRPRSLLVWKSKTTYCCSQLLASLAMRTFLTLDSSGDKTCSFNSLVLTFKTSLSSKYFNIFLAIHSEAAVQFWSTSSSTSCLILHLSLPLHCLDWRVRALL